MNKNSEIVLNSNRKSSNLENPSILKISDIEDYLANNKASAKIPAKLAKKPIKRVKKFKIYEE